MISAPPVRRGDQSPLLPIILESINERGPLRFDEFMRLALTHPQGGYYTSLEERVGTSGDFITSPEVSSSFGECLARQIAEMLERLGPGPVALVELGAGSGRLAADVLSTLQGSGSRGGARAGPGGSRLARAGSPITLLLVESSAALRSQQGRALARFIRETGSDEGVRCLQAGSLEEARTLLPGPVTGVVWSNEYYDALPARLVSRRGGVLHETWVAVSGDGTLLAAEHPAEDAELLDYAARYGAASDEGSVAEIGLEAAHAAASVGEWLSRGYQIVVDYGHPAAELYSARHPRGTLLAYASHRTNENFFDRPGKQDLTAHVNFTALDDAARAHGLATDGLTTQDRFLIALGLADRIVSLANSTNPADIRRRLALMMLLHPEGMGRTFKVLVQSKGVDSDRPLSGLVDPYVMVAAR